MSGLIFGKINLDDRPVDIKVFYNVKDKLSIYKLDEIRTLSFDNVYMGCGLIHVTEEDKDEVLPYEDKENGLCITADAILDNREELIKELNLQMYRDKIITDSELIIKAYLKWNDKCVNYLLGDFAFVIYDKKINKVFCATDCVGSRTLYYKFIENEFMFSTVISPIYNQEKINEKWICDFIALPSVLHNLEEEETVYEGIYELSAATIFTISKEKRKKTKYWDAVKDSKKIVLKTDEDYVNEFNKIFREAVRCKLRTNRNIAISMSGGLDSTSVGCVAADLLKEQNKKLISFTSIPKGSYIDNSKPWQIANEKEYVEEVKKMYTNIEINYCRCEGKDSLSDMNTTIKVLEQPYKTFQNRYWCDDIMIKAKEKGCSIVLTGQFGNFTISYGDFLTNIKTLIKDKKYISVIKEIVEACEHYNLSKKYILKVIINSYKKKKCSYYNQLLNKNMLEKWSIIERLKKNYVLPDYQYNDIYYERRLIASPAMIRQIGTTLTKTSLYRGILKRDPTMDKRVIEFCFGIDGNQYVRNGVERYLIRRAMKNIIPERIRTLEEKKGLQGADWIERLLNKKEYFLNTLNNIINEDMCEKYFNTEYLKKQMDFITDNKKVDVISCLTAISLYLFITAEGR